MNIAQLFAIDYQNLPKSKHSYKVKWVDTNIMPDSETL